MTWIGEMKLDPGGRDDLRVDIPADRLDVAAMEPDLEGRDDGSGQSVALTCGYATVRERYPVRDRLSH